jgi:hypothetical protein
MEQAQQQVAAELVGAERMLRARRREAVEQVDRIRVLTEPRRCTARGAAA